jgi:hypothetical protein
MPFLSGSYGERRRWTLLGLAAAGAMAAAGCSSGTEQTTPNPTALARGLPSFEAASGRDHLAPAIGAGTIPMTLTLTGAVTDEIDLEYHHAAPADLGTDGPNIHSGPTTSGCLEYVQSVGSEKSQFFEVDVSGKTNRGRMLSLALPVDLTGGSYAGSHQLNARNGQVVGQLWLDGHAWVSSGGVLSMDKGGTMGTIDGTFTNSAGQQLQIKGAWSC